MKSDKGHHNSIRRNLTLKEIETPEARLIKYRYVATRRILEKLHAQTFLESGISKDKWETLIFDAISIECLIRHQTQGEEKEVKQILSEQWQLDNL